MVPAPGWATALERAARARTTVILGASDSGKTTLAAFLAGALRARGLDVLVLDADLGQSELGPPTTLGLGRVGAPVARLGAVPLEALWFIGATSPVGCLGAVETGVSRLAARARPADRLIVDTSGLVAAPHGVSLKLRKLAALRPDLVIALERDGECGAVLAACAAAGHARVLRLPVAGPARARSAGARARFRAAAFDAYFAGAPTRELPLPPGTARAVVGSIPAVDGRVLVGLEDAAGDTLGVGQVEGVTAGGVRVTAPVIATAIARLRWREGAVALAILHEVRP